MDEKLSLWKRYEIYNKETTLHYFPPISHCIGGNDGETLVCPRCMGTVSLFSNSGEYITYECRYCGIQFSFNKKNKKFKKAKLHL